MKVDSAFDVCIIRQDPHVRQKLQHVGLINDVFFYPKTIPIIVTTSYYNDLLLGDSP